jgi:hypothetical protein
MFLIRKSATQKDNNTPTLTISLLASKGTEYSLLPSINIVKPVKTNDNAVLATDPYIP